MRPSRWIAVTLISATLVFLVAIVFAPQRAWFPYLKSPKTPTEKPAPKKSATQRPIPLASTDRESGHWVEFLPPWDDAEPTATGMSFLLDPPAGKHGRVIARDGHLYFEDGMRARFWGVNLVNTDCCPEKEEAEKIAAHLAKLGFNAVRFHHMSDAWYLGPLIDPQLDGYGRAETLLDRFDYFVAQLKRRGIYVYFSSNVHPVFAQASGIPDADLLRKEDMDFQAMTRLATAIEPALQEQHKRFIRIVLEHRNPYTGQRYSEDPVVAFFEIANENSLVDAWSPHRQSRLERLPFYYQQRLDELWQGWVTQKYGNSGQAMKAWASGSPGSDVLSNLQAGLELHEDARASSRKGRNEVKIEVVSGGKEDWHVQWRWRNLPLVPGRKYLFAFRGRASKPRSSGLILQEQGPPWQTVGLATRVELATGWRNYRFTFIPWRTPHNYKLAFTLGQRQGPVEISKPSLVTLPLKSKSSDGSLRLPRPQPVSDSGQTESLVDDYVMFLAHLDRQYYSEMRNFISSMGYKGPIVGTQAAAASWLAIALQAELSDVVDAHAYWDHPRFPNRPWSQTDWLIRNRPMISSPGTSALAGLAYHRVAGKPFIVSEYNHSYPNEFDAEALPLIAAFAGQQDWDGVFMFHFDASPGEVASRKSHFFDLNRHSGKLATLPLAAALYLRGDVSASQKTLTLALPLSRLAALKRETGSDLGLNLRLFREDPRRFIDNKIEVAFLTTSDIAEKPTGLSVAGAIGGASRQSIAWSFDQHPSGLASVITERSAAGVGFFAQGTAKVGPLEIQTKTPFFGVLAAISLDGQPIRQARRLLIIAAARTFVRGMTWNTQHTSLGSGWGSGVPRVEVPDVALSLEQGFQQAFLLDAQGRPRKRMPQVDPQLLDTGRYPSTWYLLQR